MVSAFSLCRSLSLSLSLALGVAGWAGVQGSCFRGYGSGCRVYGLGFRVFDSSGWCLVFGSGVRGLGLRV